jgi:hypothetical protein
MTTPPRQTAPPILAGLAIVLAVCGQYILGLGTTPDLWALPCFALALGCLLLAERLARE